jgi:hypothetical protein
VFLIPADVLFLPMALAAGARLPLCAGGDRGLDAGRHRRIFLLSRL